jgi:hypothetical protein
MPASFYLWESIPFLNFTMIERYTIEFGPRREPEGAGEGREWGGFLENNAALSEASQTEGES